MEGNLPLGFSVDALLPCARGGGPLKMGLMRLDETHWLQACPDLAARNAAFDAHPDAVQLTDAAEAPGQELAAMLGVNGRLEGAARSAWEDMCLLTRRDGEDIYRLVGAAVAFPTDWHPADKLGLPLVAMHAPIDGYAEQLATGVDRFMAKLRPGRIFGRCNWFVAPTGAHRWIAREPASEAFAHVTPENAGETLFVRCERQALRRLPASGAIVFTIGIHVAPLGQLSTDNICRLARSVATVGATEAARRGTSFYASALEDFAKRRTQANGMA